MRIKEEEVTRERKRVRKWRTREEREEWKEQTKEQKKEKKFIHNYRRRIKEREGIGRKGDRERNKKDSNET